MIYIYVIVAIILLSTLKPQYLGMFKHISLENIISKTMVLNVRYSVIIAFLIYTYMKYGFIMREGMDYSADYYDDIQKEEVCKPGSSLSPEEREAICDNPYGNSAQLITEINSSPITSSSEVLLMDTNPLYYEPGTVLYGGSGYIPSYEEAAYNNDFKFKDQPTVIENSNYQNEGFCKASDTFGNIEQKCNVLSKDICASTSCCVLVGGEKCVQGNENGPTKKMIYSDTTIKNRDAYYYQGKCYGNC